MTMKPVDHSDSIVVAFGVPDSSNTSSTTRTSGWKGNTAHPKAPMGGGGPGGSVIPGVEKADTDVPPTGVLDSSKIALAAGAGDQKPPPPTIPSRKKVSVRKSKTEDIEVYVEILEDGFSSDVSGAQTLVDSRGVNSSTPSFMSFPRKGKNIVTEIQGLFELKGTVTIQTVYGPGAKATQLSIYGRGTTKKDKEDKTTSLGFHESRHQKDYLRFLKNTPLPKFTGKVGQTDKAFVRAGEIVQKQITKYWAEMGKNSVKKTDEVGYKRSKCVRDGRCEEH